MDVDLSIGSERLQTLGFLEGVEAFDLGFFLVEFAWGARIEGCIGPPRRFPLY